MKLTNQLSRVEWVPVTKSVLKEYGRDDVGGMAAELAYWIIFSVVPFFIFLATVAGFVGHAVGQDQLLNNVTDNLYSALDVSTAETLRNLLKQVISPASGALSFTAIISAILALNSASTATLTTIKAFNRAYGVEETRNFIVLRLTGFGLTLMLILLLIGGSLLLSIGDKIIGLLPISAVAGFALNAARIIGALVLITLGLAILYWKGVNLKQQFVWLTPGSLLATIGLVVFSGLFGLYVKFFASASFNKTYGSIAGVFLFLLFLRIVSTIVLVGAEFNAEVGKRYDPELIRDKITDPRKQLPGKQPTPDRRAAREAGVSRGQVAASNAQAAQKVAAGGGGVAAATASQPAVNGNGADATEVGYADPEVEARLRELRTRPLISATEQVRAERSRLSPTERAERAKTAATAAGVSAATAVGAVLAGALRRRA